jgi:Do/DeqQ family serine protease
MSFLKKLYSRNFFIFNLVLVGVLIGFGLAYSGFSKAAAGLPSTTLRAESPAISVPADVKAALAQAEAVQNAFRYIAETVQPAVVEIDVVEEVKSPATPQDQLPWRFFFGPQDGQNQPQQPQAPFNEQGLGSGIIVRRDGKTVYVVTNNHVAGSAKKITVTLKDGRDFEATLVGKDERMDLAVVKFNTDAQDIVVAALGDSSTLKVGDWAIAIGNPFGLISSVTAGIVSALGRTEGPDGNNISDFIQTDASINKGNSGGALVNIRGEVVGINTWIASPTGGSIGLGFAIPINNVKKAINDFIAGGKVEYGWMGISMMQLADKATAAELGADPKKAVLVSSVFKQSPAEKGGVLPGDVVASVNGSEIKNSQQLSRIVGELSAGKGADITVIRDGKSVSLKVLIEPRKESVAANDGNQYPGIGVLSSTSPRSSRNRPEPRSA